MMNIENSTPGPLRQVQTAYQMRQGPGSGIVLTPGRAKGWLSYYKKGQ